MRAVLEDARATMGKTAAGRRGRAAEGVRSRPLRQTAGCAPGVAGQRPSQRKCSMGRTTVSPVARSRRSPRLRPMLHPDRVRHPKPESPTGGLLPPNRHRSATARSVPPSPGWRQAPALRAAAQGWRTRQEDVYGSGAWNGSGGTGQRVVVRRLYPPAQGKT